MNTQRIVPISVSETPQQPRLVLHADCTTCGRLNGDDNDPLKVVDIALEHTDGTSHVVVLNGTTDLPGEEWDTPASPASGPLICRRLMKFWLILLHRFGSAMRY